MSDGFSPNDAMKKEALKGLAWRKEFNRGGTMVGVARARDIANGANLSIDTVKRMNSFFARHEVDKKAEGFRPGEKGFPSNGRIAWALWGGDAGKVWASSQLELKHKKMPVVNNTIEDKYASALVKIGSMVSFGLLESNGETLYNLSNGNTIGDLAAVISPPDFKPNMSLKLPK